MIHEALYSSRSEEWPTPEEFFRNLDIEFHFTLDPCATAQNGKCARFLTKSEDGLSLREWINIRPVKRARFVDGFRLPLWCRHTSRHWNRRARQAI